MSLKYVIALAAACACPGVFAQDPGNPPWQSYGELVEAGRSVAPLDAGSMFGESVDLYTGGLSFSQTDVSLPGSSALPVAITRKFVVADRAKGNSPYVGAHFGGGWGLDIPSVHAVFSTDGYANWCTGNVPPPYNIHVQSDEFWNGHHADLPGGGELLLVNPARPMPTTGGPYRWTSEGETYFSCLATNDSDTGEGFLAIDKDGTRYWLDHAARFEISSYRHVNLRATPSTTTVPRVRFVLFASRVEDRFGNWVTYSYDSAHPERLNQITSSDGRTLTLHHDASGNVDSVSDGSRTWHYHYASGQLSQVVLPDTSAWTFDMAGLKQTSIQYPTGNDPRWCAQDRAPLPTENSSGSMTHPSGATATFTVGIQSRELSNVPMLCTNWQPPGTPENNENDDYLVFPYYWYTVSILSKQVQGPGLPSLQWTYDFGAIAGAAGIQYPPGETEPVCHTTTCADPFCTSEACSGARVLKITRSDGQWDRYIFGNSFRYNEGKLLSHEVGKGTETVRTTANTYNYATSGQQYEAKRGTSPQNRGVGWVAEHPRPLIKTETLQDEALFVWEVKKDCEGGLYCIDDFYRPTRIVRSSLVSTLDSGSAPVLPPATAPGLTAPASNITGEYAVSWTTVARAGTYQLQQRKDDGAWSTLQNTSATSRSFSGMAAGTYDYRVRACNVAGCSAWSSNETTEVTLPPAGVPELTVPPTSSTGSYTVSWTNESAATIYELQQRLGSGAWSALQNTSATSRTVSGLTSGTYGYRVRACNEVGCAGWSAVEETVVTLPPGGVPTLTVPATSATGSYTATWTSVSAATQYQLQQRKDGGTWSTLHDASATSRALSGLTSGTYDYHVRACNAGGCGGWSAVETTVVTLPPTGVPELTTPATSSSGSYTVSWTAISAATRYELQQRKNGGTWSTLQNTSATSRALSGLTSGTYDYRVRACNAGGCAGWSAVETTVVTLPPTGVPTLTAPATNNTGSYTVSWTGVSAATRYELQQRKNGGTWSTLQNTSATNRALSGLTSGTYDYHVRACNAGGCGGWSGVETTVVTLPPTGVPTLTVPATNNTGSYTVSWTAVSAATRYELQQRKNGGTWSTLQNTSATSRALSGLTSGTYDYHVRACNAGGCAGWSPVETTVVTLPPTGVPTLTAPATSYTGGYTVSWTSVSTATWYQLIHRKNSDAWSTLQANSATSRALSGLTSGTYRYQVRACNDGGCAGWSAIKTTVVTLPPTGVPTLTVPATNTTGNYTVSWTTVSAATKYQLQQRTGSGNWITIQDAAATSLTHTGQSSGSFGYRVRACNVAGCASWSPAKTIVVSLPPIAAPTLTVPATGRAGHFMTVSWTAVGNADEYKLEISEAGGPFQAWYTGSALSSQVLPNVPNSTMAFRVRACNDGGCGPLSAVKYSSIQGGGIDLAWNGDKETDR